MIYVILFLVVTYFGGIHAECGYQSCHPVKSDQINIHLIPHSHDDLGWLKTFEQYYWGSHDNVQSGGVQYIITSVVAALKKNKDRRFIYVETGFFWKWWLYQNEATREDVKQLVNNGQLEFVSGGWSMNDEGATYYQTIIDQMTWGLRKLNETFGECGRPKVAWQIDPFGHSREMASIFAQIGFDGFILNRIDYEDLDMRRKNRSLEFIWRGSPDHLGESSDIFTNVLFRHYSAPAGLCFDVKCDDEPIIDDPNSPEYNLASKAEDFVNNWIKPAISAFSSNNILVPMGDDFMYQYAEKNFFNMDKLINYMNSRDFDGVKYNVIYSTPSCYVKAVHDATNGTLNSAMKTDDFFPFASETHNYFTGYFTSRPTSKGYGRFSNNFLQVCKQLSTFANLTAEDENAKLDTLREALGVFQHHDAITGTEKENVAHDYIRLLHNGITNCENITSKALMKLVQLNEPDFTTCHMLNISECAPSETEKNLIITVYNPLGRPVNKYVRIPITDNSTGITITDPNGNQLTTQIIPIHGYVQKTPGRNSSAQYDLVFKAENVPPLGYKQYFFETTGNSSIPNEDFSKSEKLQVVYSENGDQLTMKNGDYQGYYGTAYRYYTGFGGEGGTDDPYVFRPDPDISPQSVGHNFIYIQYYGPLLSETHAYADNEWFSYVDRVHAQSSISEQEYLIGPLPYGRTSMEVIFQFSTHFEYDDQITTYSNGRESINRARDHRDTWNLTVTEPIAGNYYPIVGGITIQNGSKPGIAVINDRAQGGGSISYQNFEFMIHRNTISGGGAQEPLNETAFGVGVVTRGSFYIIDEKALTLGTITPKELSQEIYLGSWIFFTSPGNVSFESYQKTHVMEFSGLSNVSLPRNLHILTLEPWGPSTVLLRLENFIGNEDKTNSGLLTVDIQQMFSAFKVESMRETNLAANNWLEETVRMQFNQPDPKQKKVLPQGNNFNVTLEPMQIRTFILTISY
ncbi:hypothetical protein ABEB36_006748 [Hypothenemus hampei]|uniref:Alpha-mannosidase n=1 Tax=Hypothenemus hampei TaxID=57062 RepID=A0ABD1ES48_HYPHA